MNEAVIEAIEAEIDTNLLEKLAKKNIMNETDDLYYYKDKLTKIITILKGNHNEHS
jgi:hypothetical protein